MAKPYANYHSHRETFLKLLQSECEARILLLQGLSGSGKSSLLSSCVAQMPMPDRHIMIQLRHTAVGIEEIFSRSVGKIGWDLMPEFSECVKANCPPQINLSNVSQAGRINSIHAVMNVREPEDRERRYAMLTDAWFNDVSGHTQPVLIAFDTYEQAPSAVQEWLSGPFLSRVADFPTVRVVIAGQRVPSPGIEWDNHYQLLSFDGVREASEWLPIVRSMKKKIAEPADVYLRGICDALKGHPSEIMKILEALPSASAGEEASL